MKFSMHFIDTCEEEQGSAFYEESAGRGDKMFLKGVIFGNC